MSNCPSSAGRENHYTLEEWIERLDTSDWSPLKPLQVVLAGGSGFTDKSKQDHLQPLPTCHIFVRLIFTYYIYYSTIWRVCVEVLSYISFWKDITPTSWQWPRGVKPDYLRRTFDQQLRLGAFKFQVLNSLATELGMIYRSSLLPSQSDIRA